MEEGYNVNKKIFFICKSLLVGACFFVINVHAENKSVPSLSNPNVKKLNERVYVLQGDVNGQTPQNQGFNSNITFVITKSGVVVLDSGGSVRIGRMVIKEINKVTDKPITHVFNSHHHPDHWLGNHAFSEVNPAPMIIGHAYMKKRAGEIAHRALKRINIMTQGAHSDTKVVLPTITANGSEHFNVGGTRFVLIHPEHAHTKGDLIVYVPEEKLLVTGDVFFHLRTPGFHDASPMGNNATLKYLSTLDVVHVVPGHGPITNRAGLKYMRTYIALLRSEVEKYYKNGFTDLDMIDKIDVGEYRNMSGFKTRFPVNVNSMYLEIVKKTGKKLFLQQVGVAQNQGKNNINEN